jgi:hypothetical protein
VFDIVAQVKTKSKKKENGKLKGIYFDFPLEKCSKVFEYKKCIILLVERIFQIDNIDHLSYIEVLF